MIFKKLHLENFLSFSGKRVHKFPIGSNTNFHIFVGKMGTGKTNLLQAIRWVFYGGAFLRREYNYYEGSLVHSFVPEVEEKPRIRVLLEFEHEEASYNLSREIRVSQWPIKASSSIKEVVKLSRNGKDIPTSAIEERIESIAPLRMSRFFFLDGEKLDSQLLRPKAIMRMLGSLSRGGELQFAIELAHELEDRWMDSIIKEEVTPHSINDLLAQLQHHVREFVKQTNAKFTKQLRIDLEEKKRNLERHASIMLRNLDYKALYKALKIVDGNCWVIDQSGQSIPSGVLAAGEKSILALSLLLGLQDTIRCRIPLVVDAMLDRLSKNYRTRVLKAFASRDTQVMLLCSEFIENDIESSDIMPHITRIAYDYDSHSSYFAP